MWRILQGLFIIAGTYILSRDVFVYTFRKAINFQFRELPLSWKLALIVLWKKGKFYRKELWNCEGYPSPEALNRQEKIKFITPFIGFILISIGTILGIFM